MIPAGRSGRPLSVLEPGASDAPGDGGADRRRIGQRRAADRRITVGGLSVAVGFLLVATATLLLPETVRHGVWLPAHLVLAGATATAVAAVLPFFTTTLSVAPPAPSSVRVAAIALVAGGASAISLGVAAGTTGIAVTGGVAYLAGIVAIAVAAFGSLPRSAGARRPLTWLAFGVALVDVAVGAALATALLAGDARIAAAWGQLKPAHAWLNVVGFLTLTVTATLTHLAPTVAGTRIRPRRAGTVAVAAFILAAPTVALGFATRLDAVAIAGSTVAVLGAAALVGHAVGVHRDRGRWTTDPGWHAVSAWSVTAAPAWLLVALLIASARLIAEGATPAAWSFADVAAPLVVGWIVQVVIGSWTHLVPAVGPGDADAHARQRAILGRRAGLRVAALNVGVAMLVVGPWLDVAQVTVVGAGLVGVIGAVSVATFVLALRTAATPSGDGASGRSGRSGTVGMPHASPGSSRG